MSEIIQSGGRRMPFEELRERAARAAEGLQRTGAKEGGSVAILLRNDIAFIEAMLAASWAGAYSVLINWRFKPEEVRDILVDSAATHLIIHSDLLREFREIIPDEVFILVVTSPPEICAAYKVSPDNIEPYEHWFEWDGWLRQFAPLKERPVPRGSMFYTSGTTGRPKGVKRQPPPPENVDAYGSLRVEWFGLRRGMRTAVIGPMYHSVQSSYAQAAVRAGGSVFLLPRFDAEEVLRLIDGEKLTHLNLVPTMMNRLLQLPQPVRQKYDVSSLEFVIHGAAPCPPDIKRQMIQWWGPVIYEYYGTTEAGMVSRSSSAEWLQRPGTVGKAWPGRTLRIYDADGNIAPPNTEGEIYMSLGLVPNFTYHNAPSQRAAIERDGLITNGDIGYLDADGYLFLCDRKYDVVISGGVNIYPAEIEAVLAMHPAVQDAAVFGIPDSEYGEAVAAMVQPVAGLKVSGDELRAFVRKKLANFKVPRLIEIIDFLPRDDSGKIFKRVLRDRYWTATGRRI